MVLLQHDQSPSLQLGGMDLSTRERFAERHRRRPQRSQPGPMSRKGPAPEQRLSLGPAFSAVQSRRATVRDGGCALLPSWLTAAACMAAVDEDDYCDEVRGPSRRAARALLAEATQPVVLNVYELGNTSSLVTSVNKVTQDFLSQGGLFHTAVEVGGREVSFGATRSSGTGVFSCHPRRCVLHRYRQSVYLGDCSKSNDEVKDIIRSLREEWPGRSYSTLHRNCCHFAAEFSQRLGVGDLPSWVHHLADVGAKIDNSAKCIVELFEDIGLCPVDEPEALPL